MRPWLGKFPNRIVVEDSDDRPRFLNDLESEGFAVLVNGSSLGQQRSIDIAYGKVESEFIFHCEDDWEFLEEPNFCAAKQILKNGIDGHRNFSVVSFRDSTRKEKHDPKYISGTPMDGKPVPILVQAGVQIQLVYVQPVAPAAGPA